MLEMASVGAQVLEPRSVSLAKQNNVSLIVRSSFKNIKGTSISKTRKIIEKRILGRIICEKCNKTFNEHLNKEEIDNHKCGRNYLKKRKDDNQEAIIIRYDEYMKKTKPVLDFFSPRSYFHEIDGSQKIHEITSKIEQILTV